ncbi:MAG: hypothetical protein Q7U13_08070 [Rhodoferax sp.]|nr:hypothetical protein [Rhodoferax sp.]
MELHPDVQALSTAMHELEHFLRAQEHVHWADQILRCLRSIDNSDAYGLNGFLNLFGGMGSLNDLVLWRRDMTLGPENDQLEHLRSRAWELAHQLAQEIR